MVLTPELIQYGIYAGLLIGGYLLRHYGVSLPGLSSVLPGASPAPVKAPAAPAPAPTSGTKFPVLSGLLAQIGPQAETWVLGLVQKELASLTNPPAPSPAPAQPAK